MDRPRAKGLRKSFGEKKPACSGGIHPRRCKGFEHAVEASLARGCQPGPVRGVRGGSPFAAPDARPPATSLSGLEGRPKSTGPTQDALATARAKLGILCCCLRGGGGAMLSRR